MGATALICWGSSLLRWGRRPTSAKGLQPLFFLKEVAWFSLSASPAGPSIPQHDSGFLKGNPSRWRLPSLPGGDMQKQSSCLERGLWLATIMPKSVGHDQRCRAHEQGQQSMLVCPDGRSAARSRHPSEAGASAGEVGAIFLCPLLWVASEVGGSQGSRSSQLWPQQPEGLRERPRQYQQHNDVGRTARATTEQWWWHETNKAATARWQWLYHF